MAAKEQIQNDKHEKVDNKRGINLKESQNASKEEKEALDAMRKKLGGSCM